MPRGFVPCGLPGSNSRACDSKFWTSWRQAVGFPLFRVVGGTVLGFHRVLRNKRMARRLCLSVFLPPVLVCLQDDLPHEASRLLDLGTLKEAFETMFSLPFFDFSTSAQDAQGQQLKVFSAQLCWHFGFALPRALSYKTDPDRLCFSRSPPRKLRLFLKAR